jgi:hypothetical protein
LAVNRKGAVLQVAEKWFDDVIPSVARNLLLARNVESKADSSVRRKAPAFGMTSFSDFSAASLTAPARQQCEGFNR